MSGMSIPIEPEKIYDLSVGQECRLSHAAYALRVPGGWIVYFRQGYAITESHFIPFVPKPVARTVDSVVDQLARTALSEISETK